MAKKSAPKKKNKKPAVKAKVKPKAKAVVKKAAPKKTKSAPKAKAKAKKAPKAKAKPAAKKAKPAKAKKVIAPKAKVVAPPPPKPERIPREKKIKQTPEEKQALILAEKQRQDDLVKVRVSETPLMKFRQREEVAKKPKVGKVLPEEANRARYSDEELEEFREIIEGKISDARHQLNTLTQQMINANEHGTDDTAGAFKMLEDGSENQAKEEAGQLAIRQQKFIEQLEAALGRIENKTYGICVVTGKLIPKERLRAVPHTTKSIEAKLNQYRD